MTKHPPPIPAQGDAPVNFFDTPGMDGLYRMCLSLAEQLALTRDRLDTLERILQARGGPTQEELNLFEPSETDEKAKAALMAQIADNILAPLDASIGQIEAAVRKSGEEEAC